ncbi:acyltransferase family protein [uncultured Bifidobacterium sp.]|uniref:acyltransferase family protein n=1 Tax=uncultured Bifidobacterium sp. TaxID=165187 RepID=UPI002597466E|nr:acyltransferase family protein [uncultured Bifidobacterium sp.]
MANADSGRISGRRMADVGADGVSRDGKLHTAHTPRAVRNARVEALRLAAIVGISLFHTMMPWTAQALCDPAAGCSRIGDMLGSDPAVLAVLGVIALMGAWGNHVFFMISGFYLIPSLARRSTQAGYWLDALRGTVRRVLVIAVSVALVAVVALAFDAWVMPLVNVHLVWQWTLGIEFVWLYAAFVAVAPVLACLLRRVPARIRVAVACVLVVALVMVNGYVAFVSPGDAATRGLADWRKWMSAITYAVSFAIAGVAGMSGAPRPADLPRWRRRWMKALAAVAAVVLTVEAVAAIRRDVTLIAQLSYKSTSAASMALAFLPVMVCASGSGGAGVDLARASREAGTSGSVAARAVAWLASGILGFYIVQSVFGTVAMDIAIQGLLADVTRWAASGGGAAGLWLLAAGTAVSVGYVVVVAVLDGLIRRPVLRMLRLGR